MSRRVHACLSCSGGTRHADRRCSRCRRSTWRRARVWLDAGDGRMIEVGGIRSITLTPPVDESRRLHPGLHISGTLNYRGRGA